MNRLVLAAFLAVAVLGAGKGVPVHLLAPEPAGELRVAGVAGHTEKAPHRFLLKGLSVFSPVEVVLAGEGLTLNVYKYRFEDPLLTLESDPEGHLYHRFRTEGELRLEVAGPPGVPYRLLVAVGPEEPPALPVSLGTAKADRPAKVLGFPLAVGGVALLLLLGLWFRRAGFLALVLLVPLVTAQVSPLLVKAAVKLLKQAEKWQKAGAAFSKLERGREALTEADQEILDPPFKGPRLALRCATVPRCKACYARGSRAFRQAVIRLERLRAKMVGTRAFVKDAISFGDAMAGLPGGFGLGWPKERRKIQASYRHFIAVYKRKVEAAVKEADRVLRELGRCEQRFAGDADWYTRFGPLYIEFVRLHYLDVD